jgi:hypothetical protein
MPVADAGGGLASEEQIFGPVEIEASLKGYVDRGEKERIA